MKKSTALFVAASAIAAVSSVRADTIADWTFETSQPAGASITGNFGTISPEVGAGTASAFHAGASTYSSPAGNGSAHSLSSTLWATGDFYQVEFSTLGLDSINLSFAQTSSSTGPGKFVLQYSTDGTHFTQVGSEYSVLGNGTAPNASWSAATAVPAYNFAPDLTSIDSAIDNQSAVYLRFVDNETTSAGGGTVGTAGTDRIDNILVSGVSPNGAPVPDVASVGTNLLGASGVLGMFCFARRKKK